MPTVLAASTMSVPAGTVTLCPSTCRLMSGMRPRLADVACVPQAVVLVLVVEVAHRRLDHPARRVAQPTQAAPVLQPVGDSLEDAELELRSLVGKDPVVGSHRPVATDAARGAFAAGLVRVEAQEPGGGLDHAVRVVHDDDAARPAHGPEGLEAVEVRRRVDHRGGEDLGRRTARPEHLQLAPGKPPAREAFDDGAVGDPYLDLEVAGFLDVAAHGHHPCAFRLLGAAARVLDSAVAGDTPPRRPGARRCGGGGGAPRA